MTETIEIHGLTPPTMSSTDMTVFVSPQMEVIEVGVTGPQGPPGPQGAAAFVSADPGNTLSLGADTGLYHQGPIWTSTNW